MLFWTLRQLRASKHPATRASAARTLAAGGSLKAFPALCAALADQHQDVRAAAAEALGTLGDRRALEPLQAALRDTPEVRLPVTTALGKLGDRRAIPWLLRNLLDAEAAVRQAAAEALAALGSDWPADEQARATVPSLLSLLRQGRCPEPLLAWRALGSIGDARAIPLLAEALLRPQPELRQAAEAALTQIRSDWLRSGEVRAALPAFSAALGDADPNERLRLARLLAASGDKLAIEPMLRLLRDENPDVREAAAQALLDSGDHTALATAQSRLLRALEVSGESAVAAATLTRLGWQPSRPVERAWLAVAQGDWAQVVAVGREAIEPLVEVLPSRPADWRSRARSTLAEIDRRWAQSREARSATAAVVALLKEGDAPTRSAAAELLGEIAAADTADALEGSLADEDRGVRAAASRALARLEHRTA